MRLSGSARKITGSDILSTPQMIMQFSAPASSISNLFPSVACNVLQAINIFFLVHIMALSRALLWRLPGHGIARLDLETRLSCMGMKLTVHWMDTIVSHKDEMPSDIYNSMQ